MREYLKDPFLNDMYAQVREAGPLKSVLIDITHVCNIRCVGCYFFAENMDEYKAPKDEAEFDAFLDKEKERGTNFFTIVGGEPSLMMDRLKKVYDNFYLMTATNGIRKIPREGFENMPLAISVWGDHETDMELRGSGKADVFGKALRNYQDDPRAMFYYTVAPGYVHEIESVTEQIVANGNRMVFSYYGDIDEVGGELDHRTGFAEVRSEIDRMIERHPDRIFTTSYMSQVISTGDLYGERWGYNTCTSISVDHPMNAERLKNGIAYNPHFNAYNPDLETLRRCCVGNDRDCANCFDTWSHMAWIMLNVKRHQGSKEEFTNWLTTMYMWYLMNHIVDFEEGVKLLPEIHARQRYLRESNIPVA